MPNVGEIVRNVTLSASIVMPGAAVDQTRKFDSSSPLPQGRTELVIGMSSRIDGSNPVLVFDQESPSPAPSVRAIGEHITSAGEKDLDFYEAVKIIPYSAELYHRTLNTTLTPAEMTDKTYIASSEFTPEDEQFVTDNGWMFSLDNDAFLNSPFYRRLKANYGDSLQADDVSGRAIFSIYQKLFELNLFDELTNKIIASDKNYVERLLGVTVGGDNVIFVFLNATNNFDGYKIDKYPEADCEITNPAVTMITTQIHEFGHLETFANLKDGKPIDLDPRIIEASGSLFEDGGKALSGDYAGFSVRLEKEDDEEGKTKSTSFVGLDEFVVHYLATKVLIGNGLDTISIGIKFPQSMANFESILNQAGITLKELSGMHAHSQLNEFLIRVAEGAKNVELGSEDEKLKFGFKIFSKLFSDKPMWEEDLRDYFDIDLSGYLNTESRSTDLPAGCVVFEE